MNLSVPKRSVIPSAYAAAGVDCDDGARAAAGTGVDPRGSGRADAEVLDYGQIAARLDLSPSRVKQRLHRLLARLLGGEVVHAAGDRGGATPDRCAVCRGVGDQRL